MFDAVAIDNVYDYLKMQEKAALNAETSNADIFKRQARLKTLEQYAFQEAARQGIKARLSQIEKMVSSRARDLDAIYDFAPLLIKGKVIPPVITEASDIYNLENSTTIRTSDRIYQIKSQARFSSIAPNWRAYMQLPIESKAYNSDIFVSEAIMPKDEEEKQVWLAATVKGWDSGVEQANTMLENNMKRLNRDYIGMLRFHQFVLQGKLSMPLITEYDLDNSNDGNTMILNQQMLKLTQLPQFENKWIRNPNSHGYPDRGSEITGQEQTIVRPTTVDQETSTAREINLKVDKASVTPKYQLIDKNNAHDVALKQNTVKAEFVVSQPVGYEASNNGNVTPITVKPDPKPLQPIVLSKQEVDNSTKNSNSVTINETRTVMGLSKQADD